MGGEGRGDGEIVAGRSERLVFLDMDIEVLVILGVMVRYRLWFIS